MTNSTSHPGTSAEQALDIRYEQYYLENGLHVVLHHDDSNPIVAIGILYHVGSSRETTGKTGFAHFFEHMLFSASENVGKGMFFRRIDDLGGTFNGGTWTDGTIYYEVVPRDALEIMLWMESDRMGFLKNTVTQLALDREKDIVINEKRQRVDNQPYGHKHYVIDKALYAADHPYSWQVIGSMDDIRSATLEDVRHFYDTYYAVNNATLVIAGDFQEAELKRLVEKYFGEFRPRQDVKPVKTSPVQLTGDKKLFYEDNFAQLPELTVSIPTVEAYHPDSYALELLGELLSDGKTSVLYRQLVEEDQLAPAVFAGNSASELAGKFEITVRTYPGVSLDDTYRSVLQALDNFHRDGVVAEDLQRIKNLNETSFYNSISSLLGKTFHLAQSAVFANDPGRMATDIQLFNAVTPDDINRVFNRYIYGKPAIVVSVVPKGQASRAVEGSERAAIVEEEVGEATAVEAGMIEVEEQFELTPSVIDRSKEPALGEKPLLNLPAVQQDRLANGMKVLGIEHRKLPLVTFQLKFTGGSQLDSFELPGVSKLLADMLKEGTRNRTPEELEHAIGNLGADLQIYTTPDALIWQVNVLSRNFGAILALIREMMFEPRWDAKEFQRLKQAVLNKIAQDESNPAVVSRNVFNRLYYKPTDIWAYPVIGTADSVHAIGLHHLQEYYTRYIVPANATFLYAGDVPFGDVKEALSGFSDPQRGTGGPAASPEQQPKEVSAPQYFFVDFPDAKQSVILIGSPAMPRSHPDYFPAAFGNYKLGDGSGAQLFQVLRLEKGYTYGAYSYFSPTRHNGTFFATSSVQSAVTTDALQTFIAILAGYPDGFDTEMLEVSRNAIIRSAAGKFETNANLLGMLIEMERFGLPADYVKQEERQAETMPLSSVKETLKRYLEPGKMIYLVVGDAKTQLPLLRKAGYGFVEIDKNGKKV